MYVWLSATEAQLTVCFCLLVIYYNIFYIPNEFVMKTIIITLLVYGKGDCTLM